MSLRTRLVVIRNRLVVVRHLGNPLVTVYLLKLPFRGKYFDWSRDGYFPGRRALRFDRKYGVSLDVIFDERPGEKR